VNAALAGLGSILLVLHVLGTHDQSRHRIITFTVTALALGMPYLRAAWAIWRAPASR
jgi:hypothetical protein